MCQRHWDTDIERWKRAKNWQATERIASLLLCCKHITSASSPSVSDRMFRLIKSQIDQWTTFGLNTLNDYIIVSDIGSALPCYPDLSGSRTHSSLLLLWLREVNTELSAIINNQREQEAYTCITLETVTSLITHFISLQTIAYNKKTKIRIPKNYLIMFFVCLERDIFSISGNKNAHETFAAETQYTI